MLSEERLPTMVNQIRRARTTSITCHALIAFCLHAVFAIEASASPGGWDQSFAPFVSGGPVYAAAVQPDGRLLIGGAFSSVNNSFSRARLARLFGDGSLDTTFFNTGSGANGTVYCLAVQTDSRILIGGDFNSVAGSNRTRVARLNANGSVDGGFIPTNAISSSVFAVGVQSDNKVIIGGSFSSSIFPAWNARLNTDGSVDTVFNSFPNGPVNAIAIQADDKIVIGGSFTTVNGAQRSRIARLNADGSLDNTFQNGLGGASSTVRCLQIQPDGKILLGGDFTSVNNTTRFYIARLNSNGSLDTGFGAVTPGVNNSVFAVALQTDKDVVIGGNFTSYGNALASHVARLYPDGTRDTSFTNFGINSTVQALALQSDGGVVIGGTFSTVNNTNWSYLARLYGNLYPPEFLTQPVSRATNAGANVTFSALVNNPTPCNYQWRKDGNNISGATGTSYSLFNVQLADAGNYSVFVNNAAGGGTSSNALLQVGVAPVITQQPASLSVTQGQSASFTVGASGSPLNYYWRKNGLSIPGATNSSLTFSNVVFANSGNCTCLVSNFVGRATSSVAVLTVAAPPAITLQPSGGTIGVGSDFTLTVTASGTAPLAYQWAKDSAPLTDATNTSFTITNAQTNDSGAYTVTVTNALGSITSSVANISVVYFPPQITDQPVGATVLVGSNFSLTVTATGTAPLLYQWSKDGVNLSGATDATYSVTNAVTNEAGGYSVVITNVAGGATSAVAQVNVGFAPVITQQPQSFTNNLGTSNAFAVVVTGSQPLLYQWFKDGVALANATNSLLPLPNLQSNQVGFYSVTITNIYGYAISSDALLSIPGVPPSFLPQGLIAYYPFNGNANDATGNGNDGAVSEALLVKDRLGNANSAYNFNGTNSYIQVNKLVTSGQPFTWSVWFRPGSPDTNWNGSIINQGQQPVQISPALFINSGQAPSGLPGTISFYSYDSSEHHIYSSPRSAWDTNSWYQVVITLDAAGNSYLFVNGQVETTATNIPFGQQNSNFYIGANIGQSPGQQYFSGDIDDIRVYNRALSSNEVPQLYAYESDLPVITSQPQPEIVPQGSAISFSVVATAQNPLIYQWSKDGLPLSNATNTTLLLSNVQPSQAGLYSVAISNGFAGVISAPASLAVMSSTGPGAPGFTSNLFGFGISSATGTTLVVESSTNLLTWHPVVTNLFVTNTFQFLDPASATNRAAFYRVRSN